MEEKINMAKTYNPKDMEDRLYNQWIDNKYFTPEVDYSKKPYTIVIPPPNITGTLHMGHALDNTLQDILIRWKRMEGYNALWLPGTDHASIATEAKIVESLAQEGLTKEQLGREQFLERAWEWKKKYGGRIVEQLKKLGSSCDWTRERFTLDESLSEAVKEVFVRLYEKGLIYKGEKIINWCPNCNTTISDAEVDHEEKQGHLWHIRYPVKDSQEFIEVATTRPETMLGDTAVAVNPQDGRYKHLIGRTVILPLMNREIPVIADDYVEMDFGTGVVKITPAHDPNDFLVGERHNLLRIVVMNDNATMNDNSGKYRGLSRYDARKIIVEDLKELGLLVQIKEHSLNVGHCSRCSNIVEPMVKKQWFVKMRPLATPAIAAVKEGKTQFVPNRFEKIYFHWLENIQDWCISRQLWWGHRIPAYYCGDCGEIIVSKNKPENCNKCNSHIIKQDEDTLDTWFSSALWPFSTLGWPEQTEDLKYFYPTNVLVTGYDIIFFWVVRMMFSALENMDAVPFDTVLIHGLVRDAEGRKMSKSLGNGVDPLGVIEQYGTDALRFMLATGNSPGNDMRFSLDRVEACRNFANKLWNASRFVLMNIDENDGVTGTINGEYNLNTPDKWILSRVNNIVLEVKSNLEKYEIGIAAQKLYDFVWTELCDWYIELSKPVLYGEDDKAKKVVKEVLIYTLTRVLKLLHPFMPFITEEIWQSLPKLSVDMESIVISNWPLADQGFIDEQAEEKAELTMSIIRSIRNIRAEANVVPSKKAKVIIIPDDDIKGVWIKESTIYIEKLASSSDVLITSNKEDIPEESMSAVVHGAKIYLPLFELVDIDKEIERLQKEKEKIQKELDRVSSKLSNEGFVAKAPVKVIEEEKEKLSKYQQIMVGIIERLDSLSNKK